MIMLMALVHSDPDSEDIQYCCSHPYFAAHQTATFFRREVVGNVTYRFLGGDSTHVAAGDVSSWGI